MRSRGSWGGLFVLAVAGCHPSIPPYSVHVPPRLDDVRPPRSVAFVHDEIGLGPASDAIARAVPPEVAGQKKGSVGGLPDIDYTWRLERRPTELRGDANGIALVVPLAGTVTAQRAPFQCRADDASVTFAAELRPALRPNGDIGLDHLEWKPRVGGTMRCAGLRVPIDAALDGVVAPLADALAKLVSTVELPTGPLVEQALVAMREPRAITLDAKGPGSDVVCLDLAPDAIVLSPIAGAGRAVSLKLGAEVAPRIVVGACPPAAVAPLSRVIAKNVPLADHFTLAVAIAEPYADLTARVAPSVVGHRFGDADHGITVDAIELADTGGRTLVHLTAHGTLSGDLYLWGTPTVVEQGGRFTLRVPDAQLAIESRSVLIQMGLAVWRAVGGDLEGLVREKLAVDVTDRVAQIRAALSGRHELGSAGGVTAALTTSLARVRPGATSSRAGVLIAEPVLVGEAELEVGAKGR